MTQLRAFIVGLLGVVSSIAASATSFPDAARADRIRSTWLDRPWEFRYLLEVSLQDDAGIESIRRRWHERVDSGRLLTFSGLAPLTDAAARFAPTGKDAVTQRTVPFNTIQVFALRFDPSGKALNPRRPLPATSRARMTQTLALYLQEDESRTSRLHFMASWFQGVPAAEAWAPAVCSDTDMPTPVPEGQTRYRYGPKFEENNDLVGHFGCREWSFQLKDRNRPYIDVTSYEATSSYNPTGTYVRPFIGFSRFEDKPKPIIGANRGQWFCLYDCPLGESPGPIADIKAWSNRFGWAPPERPKRQPMFPDALYEGRGIDK